MNARYFLASLLGVSVLTAGCTQPVAPVAPTPAAIPDASSTPPADASPAATPSDTAQRQDDLVEIATPQPNQTIDSPLTVSGRARGTWYFEASFPVTLLDADGVVVARSHAQAQSEWMTPEFVPFSATIVFDAPATPTGELVLEKDNPSGEAGNAQEQRIPVRFALPGAATPAPGEPR